MSHVGSYKPLWVTGFLYLWLELTTVLGLDSDTYLGATPKARDKPFAHGGNYAYFFWNELLSPLHSTFMEIMHNYFRFLFLANQQFLGKVLPWYSYLHDDFKS